MTDKRNKKLRSFYADQDFLGYEVINPDASIMLIVTSFTSYTAKAFVKNNPYFGVIIMKVIKPLDNRLRDELMNCEEIVFFEHNASGQLENYMTEKLKLDQINDLKITHVRKYDLFPFFYEDFEKALIVQ